ncbi:MAG: GNAT family N-acetyltransferase [Oscillospiraceae bacterium]|nr:GNAT family N-acetyltransferase [Oscillospiraceae bacterium]
MFIRKAEEKDIRRIDDLLLQVLRIHYNARPDIFRPETRKYTDEELKEIIADPERPIFVAEVDGRVEGYAFCIFQQHTDSNNLNDIGTLYIDDLCVDENCRGMHIGEALYRYVLDFARESGCYNVTLNVWRGNESARGFYEAMGMSYQKYVMEQIL